MTRPAEVVVSHGAARANLERAKQLAPQQRVMAVIKADAYGHGLVRMARALQAADAFGVASIEEGVALRNAGFAHAIVLLEGVFDDDELTLLQHHKLQTVVHHLRQVEMLERLSAPPRIKVWLKVDSGMHRLGFAPEQVKEMWRRLQAVSVVDDAICLMTHLANADNPEHPSIKRQLSTFEAAVSGLPGERSIANSAAVIGVPDSHADWIRPGLMLYGISPVVRTSGADVGLAPVMTLRSELIAVRMVAAGEGIGYGAEWRCPEPMPVGIVAMGYGDGYPRHAENGTPVLVNEQRVQLVGRSSMDMLSVDLRTVPNARVGDPVTLWGEGLPIEEVAQAASTVAYELLCSARVRARYVEHD